MKEVKTSSMVLATILAVFFMIAFIPAAFSQGGPPPPPPPGGGTPAGAPIDEGMIVLISSCVAYAYYKFRK